MWNFTTFEGANFIFESLLVVFVCLLFRSSVFRFNQRYIHREYIHSESGQVYRLVFLTGVKVIISSGPISLVASPPSF